MGINYLFDLPKASLRISSDCNRLQWFKSVIKRMVRIEIKIARIILINSSIFRYLNGGGTTGFFTGAGIKIIGL